MPIWPSLGAHQVAYRTERDTARLSPEERLFGGRQLGTVIAARCPKNMFYNWPGRCREMRAFSGSAWETHVLDGASKIPQTRHCFESAQRSASSQLGPLTMSAARPL